MRCVLSIALVISITWTFPTVSTFAIDKEFTDVRSSYWAYDSIVNAMNKEIVNGYPDGSFRPTENITYAQFMAILTRAFYFEEFTVAKDTNGVFDVWYEPYTTILSRHNILYGTRLDTDFNGWINKPLMLFDMAQAMYNILLDQQSLWLTEGHFSFFDQSTTLFESIPDNYRTAVSVFYSLNLLNGRYNNEETFINRAQACIAIENLSMYVTPSEKQVMSGLIVKATLSLDEASPNSVKIILTNFGEKEISYTQIPIIEYYSYGEWLVYPIIQETNTDMAILRTIQPRQSREYIFDLSYYYGTLPPGLYLFRVSIEQDGREFFLTANTTIIN
jgi:hypothetical protein